MWLILSQLTFNLTVTQPYQMKRKKYDITSLATVAKVSLKAMDKIIAL